MRERVRGGFAVGDVAVVADHDRVRDAIVLTFGLPGHAPIERTVTHRDLLNAADPRAALCDHVLAGKLDALAAASGPLRTGNEA